MSGLFQEAREGLRAARAKLDAIDHLFGLLDTLAASLRNHGQVPELVYDPETGTASLHVRVGRVPPQVSVTVASDVVARSAPKPSLGDLSDALQGLDSAGAAGIGAVEPSEVPLEALRVQPPEAEGARPAAGGSPAPVVRTPVPCPCMGHDEMCPCQNKIPSETDGVTTAEHPRAHPDADGGSRGSRLASGRTDASGGGSGAAEGEAPAAGESPAPITYKRGAWFPQEEKRLLALHDEGKLLPDMVQELGRAGPGVAAKLRSLLAKRAIPKAGAVAARVTQAPPPPRPAVAPPAAGPVLQARPRHEREAEARLDAAQDPEWPPARDLDLMVRMTRGDGAGGTAEDMGIPKDAVLARWRRLFPNPPTIED